MRCAYCWKPFDTSEVLRAHVDTEHAEEYAAYKALWDAIDAGQDADPSQVVQNLLRPLLGDVEVKRGRP